MSQHNYHEHCAVAPWSGSGGNSPKLLTLGELTGGELTGRECDGRKGAEVRD